MRLGLLVLGVGEFRSFQDDVQDSVFFVRLMQEGGDTFELSISEDQLSQLVSRFAEQAAAAPPDDPPPPRSQPATRPPPAPLAPFWTPPEDDGDDGPVVVFQAADGGL
jgi:hypothetical protein